MAEASSRKTGIYVTSVLSVALAAGSGFALYQLAAPGPAEALAAVRAAADGGVGAAFRAAQGAGLLPWLLLPTVGPFLLALLLLVVAPKGGAAKGAQDAEEHEEAPAELPGAAGLRLLAALQEEARLVDFVRENLDDYSDEQVGAAVRGIHSSLRKAVDERLGMVAILEGEDGDPVEVPADFDPALIRVTGNPSGEPPYKGVLRHGGWKATDARLPVPTPGSDPTILAPAEVEVGGE
ncbi:MAG: DUF2760 domain-containing protein [Candidatus Binatia bacterium]|nr:DUF2760 domain-containing protein [Candidatus Binatia bacterium]